MKVGSFLLPLTPKDVMQSINIKPIEFTLLKVRAYAIIGGLLINKGKDQVFVDQSIEIIKINDIDFKIVDWELDTVDEDGNPYLGGNNEVGWLHLRRCPADVNIPVDEEIMGLDNDGNVTIWNNDNQRAENTGQTPEEYGLDNMTEIERARVALRTFMPAKNKRK